MKRILVLLVCVFSFSMASSACTSDKPVQVNQLPAAAQSFIKKHFPNAQVSLAKVDNDFLDKSYDVIFTNGDKLEFDKGGNWKEIKCSSNSQVPSAIIPSGILSQLSQNYSGMSVLKIEQDKKGYEVKLSNGLELKFDKQFNLVDVDH